MAASDLTTLGFVKSWLQLAITDTRDDGFLQHQVSAASAAIQNRLNRTILRTSYTEVRNGSGAGAMKLINYPVRAVSSVTVGNTAVPVRSSPTSDGYVFDEALVYLSGWSFPRGQQNVTVVYEAGYDQVPPDLEDAVAGVIAFKYRNRDRIGVSSKVLAGETNAYFAGVSKDILEVIDQYKRVYTP